MMCLTRLPCCVLTVLLRQAKELLDHLEGVLSNEPIEVRAGRVIACCSHFWLHCFFFADTANRQCAANVGTGNHR